MIELQHRRTPKTDLPEASGKFSQNRRRSSEMRKTACSRPRTVAAWGIRLIAYLTPCFQCFAKRVLHYPISNRSECIPKTRLREHPGLLAKSLVCSGDSGN